MSNTASPKKLGFSSEEDHTKNQLEPWAVSKNVFISRNSSLTDLIQLNTHIQTLFNILWTICLFLLVHLVAYYRAKPSMLWEDLDIVKSCFIGLPYFVLLWLLVNLLAFAFYEGLKLWIYVRNGIDSKVADRMFLLLYIVGFFGTLFGVAAIFIKTTLGYAYRFVLAIEQVRIYMKIHSYIRENISRVLQCKRKKEKKYALSATRKHYLYYLFAPTLIYRDSYPRTKKCHLGKCLHHLFEIILCVFVGYCIHMRFYKDVLKNVGFHAFTKREAALLLPGIVFTGPVYLFLTHYGLFHSWLNFTAEFLRFGDRKFYQEWWNSTNFMQFFRAWNSCVYDWLYAYVYADLRKLGCNRTFSQILVFFISAVFHDYVLGLTLGFLFPLMSTVHFLSFIFVIPFLPSKGIKGNIVLWIVLFLAWGTFYSSYTMEVYARKNCPKEETMIEFFKPRILDPSCQILNFSFF